MSLFRRFLGNDSEKSVEYLCQLVAEQNQLMRELIRVVSGRPATSPVARTPANVSRIRTDKDVFRVVSRDQAIRQDLEKQMAEIAPWRLKQMEEDLRKASQTAANGQDSAPVNPGAPTVPPAPIPSPELF